jgi:hypothetical protein
MSFPAAGRRRLPAARAGVLRPDAAARPGLRARDRRYRRAAAGAGAACAVLAATGCVTQARVSLPAKSSGDVAPAALTAPRQSPRQQVAAAYDGYWQAYARGMDARSAAVARSILAGYLAPATMAPVIASYRRDWAAHDIAYGGAVTHVLSVAISGPRATLHDCLDLSGFGFQKEPGGQVVADSFGQPRVNFYVTLVRSRGRWLVANMQPVVVPCEP